MILMLANAVVHLSAFVVLICTLLSINEMTASTNHLIRIAYCCMATSAVACVLGQITGTWLISPPCAAAMVGMAIMLTFDRRKRWTRSRDPQNQGQHVTH